jgi:hypothetical protein
MLGNLLGSVNKERVLVYLAGKESGYSRQIARFFDAPLYPIQQALEKLEAAGVVVSRSVGSTREYQFDPRYPARKEIAALLERAISLYPKELRDRLQVFRARPRRKGKPL